MEKILVQVAARQYEVLIERGLLAHVGELVATQWSPRKVAVISDQNVAALYQKQVVKQLEAVGFEVFPLRFPAGETSKSLSILASLAAQLAQAHFTRDDGIVALGGGVTGDLAGLVAATYMRGVRLIQIPTSWLAQVDSSVGGKTAVNLAHVKNLLGAFYEPDLVLVDPAVLGTLPQRELIAGHAEVIKTAALAGGDFWQLVKEIRTPAQILELAPALSAQAIAFKAKVVMADEREGSQRQILNFGHTLGHAVEALAQGRLRHGEAISVGMAALSQRLSQLGWVPTTVAADLTTTLVGIGLPVTAPELQMPAMIDKIANDKKNRGANLNLVYLPQFGQPKVKPVAFEQARAWLLETI